MSQTMQLAVVIVAASRCLGMRDDTSLLQMASAEREARLWQTDRDLAWNMDQHFTWDAREGIVLSIFSAVPTFSEVHSHIALLMANNETVMDYAKKHPLYCSYGGKPQPLRVLGMPDNGLHESDPYWKLGFNASARERWSRNIVLVCDWPGADQTRESYKVTLHSDGLEIGTVLAKHNPQVSFKKYQSVACVREIFVRRADLDNSPLLLLPQWLEWHRMRGVEHFLFYTFDQHLPNEYTEIMEPFVKSGLATRVHFHNFPTYHRQRHYNVVADCLERMKGKAKWMMPAIDVDEYLSMDAGVFPDRKLPRDYLRTGWDALAKFHGKNPEKLHSISFTVYRFEPAPVDRVSISSRVREGMPQRAPIMVSHPGPGWPKYVANVDKTYTHNMHWCVHTEKDTENLWIPVTSGRLHHYRVQFIDGGFNYKKNWEANITDGALVGDAELLEAALEKRYGGKAHDLLTKWASVKLPVEGI